MAMTAADKAAFENARLMQKFGDDLRTMPAILRQYRTNLDIIAAATRRNAERRRVPVGEPAV